MWLVQFLFIPAPLFFSLVLHLKWFLEEYWYQFKVLICMKNVVRFKYGWWDFKVGHKTVITHDYLTDKSLYNLEVYFWHTSYEKILCFNITSLCLAKKG